MDPTPAKPARAISAAEHQQRMKDAAAAKDQQIQSLQAKVQDERDKRLAPELTEDDKGIIKKLLEAPTGLRHSEIESATGFHSMKVLLILARLQKRNFIAVHGGGHEPQRIKLDIPGLQYAADNNLFPSG